MPHSADTSTDHRPGRTRPRRSATLEAHHLLLAIAARRHPRRACCRGRAGPGPRAALDQEFEHSLDAVGVSFADFGLPRPTPVPQRTAAGASSSSRSSGCRLPAGRTCDRPHAARHPAAEVGTVPRALALAGVDRAELIVRVTERAVTPEAVHVEGLRMRYGPPTYCTSDLPVRAGRGAGAARARTGRARPPRSRSSKASACARPAGSGARHRSRPRRRALAGPGGRRAPVLARPRQVAGPELLAHLALLVLPLRATRGPWDATS